MPKAGPMTPLSGLFGVCKPSGPTSMAIVTELQRLLAGSHLFADPKNSQQHSKSKRKPRPRDLIKIGQGGTLDPLADGVLVIGINKGTKRLSDFLHCTKEYRTTCLLGCETDTYDGEGSIVRTTPWKHVTRELVESKLSSFTGDIQQTPPIFSALKMDGKPLYEYAREGIPLPRPIEPRSVTVHSLEIEKWLGSDHEYRWPTKVIDTNAKEALAKTLSSTQAAVDLSDTGESVNSEEIPTAFILKMSVTGGTYVRSIVHDLSHSLNSAGHVVTLQRTRQGRYTLQPSEENDKQCVPWEVFSKAISEPGAQDSEGLTDWERQIRERLEVIE